MPLPSYLRFPHLRGDTLVFTAEDDVWTVPVTGGRAHRITADVAPVANPRLSPDGTRVAWTSWREGGPDVFVTALDGGVSRRLTWWGDPRVRCVGWDGEDVVAVTSTGYHSTRRTFAFAVPSAGGAPRALPYGAVGDVVRSGPSTLLLSVLSREPAWWKRYRGGTAGKLWWDADGSGGFVRVGAGLDAHVESPMLVGGRIAFVADHEGWGNVYSLGLDGTDLRRHTDHGGEGAPAFYVRHATSDGERVVYESAGGLWILESLDAAARRLDVHPGGPRTAREPFRVAGRVDVAVPDRTGRTSIALLRGTVHRLTHRDGPARTLLAEPGARARLARPLGDERAVWVDDVLGEDAVCVAGLDPLTGDAPRRSGAGELGRVLELSPSPDGTTVALTTHDGRLLLLDAASGELRELARSADGVEMSGPGWSPDSAWLAYAEPVEQAAATRIVLARVADGELVPVTPSRFLDRHPTFTHDGRYLAFLSRRSFDPIYDEHSFDLTFPASWRPFLVPLAARTPSPFGASPDGRPVSPGDEGPADPPAPAADDPSAPDATAVPETAPQGPDTVVVDVEGLADRVVPVPVVEARYTGLGAGADCLLWVRHPVDGVLGAGRAGTTEKPRRAVLERFDLVRRKLDVIADPVDDYAVSGDGTRLLVRDGKALRVLRTDRSGSGTPDNGEGADEYEVDLARVAITVDPTASWRQMFDEAARLMRDHFWTADMAGVDWAAEQERYRPLVDAVGSYDDLVDLLWELQGELGSSHAYVSARGRPGNGGGRPAFLGADLARIESSGESSGGSSGDADGWRIERVLPPETSAPAARSPLAAPGVDVRAGDVLLEVAGRPVDPDLGPAPLLAGTAGTLTELTVRRGAELRRVVVRPLADETELRYQDWVAGRRAFVTERSGGRLGYLHVPDMMAPGWAQLHRDLSREIARDGLVLDVRINSGGHTSQLIVEKLARRVTAWRVARHRPPRTYPFDAPRGPVVAVADELSASDGDIVTVAIKRRGIGPVVGVRTWGGVIGIDGRYGLVDGTGVTQPRYSHWFDDLGWGVENHGVDPDVEVVVRPQDWAAGRDPQLERAVDIALEALTTTTPVRPPDIATRPTRRRRELPPRP
jgi:tricorn protease